MQGHTEGLAAKTRAKPLLDEPDQTAQRPAWLGISPRYGRLGRGLLGGAEFGIEAGGDGWAKGGRPPLRW